MTQRDALSWGGVSLTLLFVMWLRSSVLVEMTLKGKRLPLLQLLRCAPCWDNV